jgi:hypothetical protein
MTAPKRPKLKRVDVVGRRWFQKTYGNTYNTVEISVNDGPWVKLPREYGYGDYYLQRALDWLVKEGYVTLESQHEQLWQLAQRLGFKLNKQVLDVARQRDL